MFRLLFFSLFSLVAFAQAPQQYVEMAARFYQHNDATLLAVSLTNEKGWHTYWKNPGDAGMPPVFAFQSQGQPLQFEAF